MHLSNQSLLVIIFVGIVAGWLAGRVTSGGGFGLIGDLLVGLSVRLSVIGCCQGLAFTLAPELSPQS